MFLGGKGCDIYWGILERGYFFHKYAFATMLIRMIFVIISILSYDAEIRDIYFVVVSKPCFHNYHDIIVV